MKRILSFIATILAISMLISSCGAKTGSENGGGDETETSASESGVSVSAGSEKLDVTKLESLSGDPTFTLPATLTYVPLGTLITVECGPLAPESITLRDYLLDESGKIKYQNSVGSGLYDEPEFTYSDGKLSLELPVNFAAFLSSNLADYEKGAVRRGFVVSDASGAAYSFVLSSDASSNETVTNTSTALAGTKLTLSGNTDGASEFAAAYNAVNVQEPLTADQMVNITPKSMSGSSVKIFKNALDCSSYVYNSESFAQLGQYYGGIGVTSVVPCSFAGGDEFLFTYSFEVGSHTSYVGWYHDGAETIFDYTAPDTELVLLRVTDTLFYLCTASVTNQNSYADITFSAADYVKQLIPDGAGGVMLVGVES